MIGAPYQKLAVRIDSLQLRERVLLLIVSIAFLYFLADSMGFQPLLEEQQLLLQEIKEQEIQLEILRTRSGQSYSEPEGNVTTPIEAMQQEVSDLGQRLQSRLDNMLSPDKAVSVLEQVITREEGLTLNSVNTRQIPLITNEAEDGRRVAIDNIDRYELALQLEGGYLETLRYLRALEALPWKFFWKDITFATFEYPKAIVDLEIYTLGQQGR